ncbi:MAG: LON peptidase substrate-binding domain-containing protein [Oscillospiraceae bacterium]
MASATSRAAIADFIAQNIYLKPEEKQSLLEELRPSRRLASLCRMLTRELTLLSIERDLNESTQEQMNRNQREYYLREQMKVIQSELGEDDMPQELDDYREKIKALGLDEGDGGEAPQGGRASRAALRLRRGQRHPRLSRHLP